MVLEEKIVRKEEKIKLEICSIEIVIEIVGKKKKKKKTINEKKKTK